MLPPDLISLFVAPLNRLGVMYMVTGSVASGTYSHIRFTNGVDLVAVLSDVDAGRLHAAFDTPAFYVPPLDVIHTERSRSAHGHINLIHVDTGLKADIFFSGDDSLMNQALQMRKRVTDQHGEAVWFAPPEYVILSKLRYLRDGGSPKHSADIQAMLLVRGDSLDMQFLLTEVETGGLPAEWQQVRK